MLKDLEKLAVDCQREEGKTVTDDFVDTSNHTVHDNPYLTSVDSRHVSDGDWGILPVHPTDPCHVGVRHPVCTVPKMRICHPISEHVQSGAALYQRWT